MTRICRRWRGMRLAQVNLGNSPVTDISVLKGMPIKFLCVNITRVEDLSPLEGMPLERLDANRLVRSRTSVPLPRCQSNRWPSPARRSPTIPRSGICLSRRSSSTISRTPRPASAFDSDAGDDQRQERCRVPRQRRQVGREPEKAFGSNLRQADKSFLEIPPKLLRVFVAKDA